jgi:putative ABC transport system permease protein
VRTWTAGWRQDARQAARSTVRQTSHSLAVVLGLSVGLTVSITTFSALSSLMYGDRPGVKNRSDLVQVSLSYGGTAADGRAGVHRASAEAPSLNDFAIVRDAGPALGALAAEAGVYMAAAGRHGAIGINGAFVSGNYFDLLGTRPLTGRLLTPSDETGDRAIAVVSDYFWRTHLDGAADAVGAPILLATMRGRRRRWRRHACRRRRLPREPMPRW